MSFYSRYGYGGRTIGPLVVTSPNCMGSSNKRNRKRFPKKKNRHGRRSLF